MNRLKVSPPNRKGLLGVSAMLLLGALAGAALPGTAPSAAADPQLPQAPANGELGFVFTAFAPAIHQGPEDCPEGMAGTIKENFLATLPAAERTRLLLPANEEELTRRWKETSFGPNNTNICTNADMFDRPMTKTVKGTISYGLNLDGDTSGKPGDGCSHENFTGASGEQGIDNQAYRAMGCTRNWRGVDGVAGDIVRGSNNALATGEQTIVMLLRGVDNLKEDPDVEVVLTNTNDRPVLDSKRNFVTGASFTVIDNPRWHNVLHGHIHDGVLTTDPSDIVLTHRLGHGGIRGQRAEFDLRRGRLRLSFKPDGSLVGILGAYQFPRKVIESSMLGGYGTAVVAGIDCAAELGAMMRLADGLKDPATGKCTAVSSALDVTAVPAFVNDRHESGASKNVSR